MAIPLPKKTTNHAVSLYLFWMLKGRFWKSEIHSDHRN